MTILQVFDEVDLNKIRARGRGLMPGLSRKVGDVVEVGRYLPLRQRFLPSGEGVIVELKPEMGGYLVEAPDGTHFYMGHMEFEFTGRNVHIRYDREEVI